ncbi:Cell division protein FtsH [Helicobacter mustelae]|nr:Cell division protein FtsH [Helicobacter mustelae]
MGLKKEGIMQKSKKSLYIGIIGLVIVILLSMILLMREHGTLVSARDFQYFMQSPNAPKNAQIDSKYLYFQLDQKTYRVHKDGISPQALQSLKITDKTSDDTYFLFFAFYGLLFVFGIFILKNKGPKQTSNIIEKSQEVQSSITSMESSVRFSDVAGIAAAKEELLDIVDFLKSPQKYQRFCISMPRGVLLVGPPGVGKTLIAKAMAGEAGVPFFYQSSASFVQIYTGMGAKRVRELFSVAQKNAPAIIFIDEIDALGKARGGNRSDEREATLNELLMQMDGFSENAGVIVIGATNKVEVLDEALLRSGRFDRKVFLELPNLEDRKEILKVHLRKKHYDFDLLEVARLCVGFSGAALGVLINEAGIVALKDERDIITKEDILAVKDKVFSGKKMQTHLDLEQREIIGIYQSTKALSALLLGLEYEKFSLVGDFFILSDGKFLSAGYLEKKVKFYLSGALGVMILKGERYSLGAQDMQLAQNTIEEAKKYQIDIDLKEVQQEFLEVLQKNQAKISQIQAKLLDLEVLSFEDVRAIVES